MAAVGNLAWTVAFLIGGFTAGYAVLTFLGDWGVLNATFACCLLLILPSRPSLGAPIIGSAPWKPDLCASPEIDFRTAIWTEARQARGKAVFQCEFCSITPTTA